MLNNAEDVSSSGIFAKKNGLVGRLRAMCLNISSIVVDGKLVL